MKYQKSFEILEKAVPDAKYHFTSGTVVSSVTESDISMVSEHGKALVELGWFISDAKWCLTL